MDRMGSLLLRLHNILKHWTPTHPPGWPAREAKTPGLPGGMTAHTVHCTTVSMYPETLSRTSVSVQIILAVCDLMSCIPSQIHMLTYKITSEYYSASTTVIHVHVHVHACWSLCNSIRWTGFAKTVWAKTNNTAQRGIPPLIYTHCSIKNSGNEGKACTCTRLAKQKELVKNRKGTEAHWRYLMFGISTLAAQQQKSLQNLVSISSRDTDQCWSH